MSVFLTQEEGLPKKPPAQYSTFQFTNNQMFAFFPLTREHNLLKKLSKMCWSDHSLVLLLPLRPFSEIMKKISLLLALKRASSPEREGQEAAAIKVIKKAFLLLFNYLNKTVKQRKLTSTSEETFAEENRGGEGKIIPKYLQKINLILIYQQALIRILYIPKLQLSLEDERLTCSKVDESMVFLKEIELCDDVKTLLENMVKDECSSMPLTVEWKQLCCLRNRLDRLMQKEHTLDWGKKVCFFCVF